MKFFVDTADLDDIERLSSSGFVDGVTTNPSLVAKSGVSFLDLIERIAALVEGPVSAEVASSDTKTMLREAEVLAEIAPNVAIKVPLTPAGLETCRAMASRGRQVNVTLCFSAGQAILAAKAGAAFLSPFVGRLDDAGADGMGLIRQITKIYASYPKFETEVLVASVRSVNHVIAAAETGADIVTVPPPVIDALYGHPLTTNGLAQFEKDWAKSGQKIL